MKKFNNLGEYLQSVRELPEIKDLLRHQFGSTILGLKFADAFASAFQTWYEARCYRTLCSSDEDNGYPGDRAAFSLALKSAFFQYRYAWSKTVIDRALEALARSLPDVDEVDGYEETQPFVNSMKRRTQIIDIPNGRNPFDALEGLGGLEQALKSVLGGNPLAEVQGTANPLETLRERLNDQLQERLQRMRAGKPTPGCDCPRCTALRAQQGSDAPTDAPTDGPTDGPTSAQPDGSDDDMTAAMPPGVRKFFEQLQAAARQTPRDQLIQQSRQIREAIAEGRIQEVVDETLASIPPSMRAINIQAGLTLSAELGFGDIVDPYVAAVNTNGKFPGFTAAPIAGSPDEAHYNAVLAQAREQLDA